MKTKFRALIIALLLTAITILPALAQDTAPALDISLSRDFGYGGFAGDIQGTFTLKAKGPADLVSVHFMIDEETLAEDSEAPYKVQFHTDAYEDGIHIFSAVGTLADGSKIDSDTLTRDFVAGDAVWDSMGDMLIPLLAVIGGITLIGVLGPVLLSSKVKQRPVGQYGPAGGAVCKNCQLPFSRNMLSPNLLVGKLSRCPHCDKWQISARAWGETLSDAEDRLRTDQTEGVEDIAEQSEEDRLREQLDASRFDE